MWQQPYLRDGHWWSGRELKRNLMAAWNFQAAVEAQIDHIVTTPANVQIKGSASQKHRADGTMGNSITPHAARCAQGGFIWPHGWGFMTRDLTILKLRLVGSKRDKHLAHYFFGSPGGGLSPDDED